LVGNGLRSSIARIALGCGVAALLGYLGFRFVSGPSSSDVLALARKRIPSNNVLVDLTIADKASSRKVGETRVYPVSVSATYIEPGLCYGYDPSCGEVRCCEATEYRDSTEYLLGKDQWDQWTIVNSRRLSHDEVAKHSVPGSRSIQDFFKDRAMK